MSEFWQRRLLILAAAWNVIGGASALIDPAKYFAQMDTSPLTLTDPMQAFFFRCTWINAIAWGLAYLLAAFLPGARRPVLIAGGLGKLAYFFASLALYRSGGGNSVALAAGIVDLALAAGFVFVLVPARQRVGT